MHNYGLRRNGCQCKSDRKRVTKADYLIRTYGHWTVTVSLRQLMKSVTIWAILLTGTFYGQQTEKPSESVEKVYFSADFENGKIAPMEVGTATCAIDATTGANGSQQSVKCTCKYTAKGTTSCSGGGGQAEITYTYSGDPAAEHEHWESYWLKTDKQTADAAQVGPRGQIKLSVERVANHQNGWQLEAIGFVQGERSGRLSVYKCDNGCPFEITGVNIADGNWHRVVKEKTYDGKNRGCVTVWVDNMKNPVIKNFCSPRVGNTKGNYTLRLGIPYAAYSGDRDGEYAVWIDEVRSADHDIR